MRKTILEIEDGQCRYCVTNDSPFLFCGDVTALDRVYCDAHHAICNTGFGRDVEILAATIIKADHNVLRDEKHKHRDVRPAPVDEVMK